jgi:hypothetical protein
MQPATHVRDPGAEAEVRIRLKIDATELDNASPGCTDEPAALPLDMPALQTGHLVLYQTASFELISDLVVGEPQRIHKIGVRPHGLIRTSAFVTSRPGLIPGTRWIRREIG